MNAGPRKRAMGKAIIDELEKEQLKDDVPDFGPGDTVRVHLRITEGGRERTQSFEGTVISRRHGGASEQFTLRRMSHGVGVERTFLLHSPRLERVEVLRRGKVRRAKLYYLRKKVGRAGRIKEAR